ncbi:hypothetical protein Tdes44962_MAKER00577 [Teratosphaeria destructans]|uniref:Uncharacterized protein n=1 Tax=Teratosphaeria destructans TaxID=418781 RepID=A0A9W7SN93_9PEZI|nr:hypothetical protein Tdes44962_MAKER00577 [Teratosphaeria destructans]
MALAQTCVTGGVNGICKGGPGLIYSCTDVGFLRTWVTETDTAEDSCALKINHKCTKPVTNAFWWMRTRQPQAVHSVETVAKLEHSQIGGESNTGEIGLYFITVLAAL